MEEIAQCLVAGASGTPSDVLWRMSDDELEALVQRLDGHLNQTHAWLVEAVAEADRRALPGRRKGLTTRQWIRTMLGTTKSRAGRLATTARALRSMPNVVKGMLAGEIGPESGSMLAAARSRHPEAFELHEETFAFIARELDSHRLRTAIQHWRQQVDHAEALRDCDSRRERRRMSLHQTFDGMWHHDADYDPESGHIISTALTAHADPGNIDPTDTRTYPQRMVDALTDVCRFYLDHGDAAPTSGGEKPHINVTVEYDQLVPADAPQEDGPLPEIDGTPVDPETIRRLACDAGIVRVVVDGQGEPLDVGRRSRTVTPAIRRGLDVRDGGCRWNGCDAPAGWADAHHIVHWADGGPTSLDNMVLLCRKHHTAVHGGTTAGLPARFTGGRPEPP